MAFLSKPSAEKTRALRAAVAAYQDHIGLHDNAEFMRAQPDDFTQWSGYAHQLVTMMDKKTFEKDLPPNIAAMMDYSKEKTAELTARNRGLANLAAATVSKSKDKWGGRRQSENVIDRQDKGRLPVEPSLLAQALEGAQEIGERGQRGFGKLIAALMGDGEIDTPQPRSKEDLARNIRGAYGAETWGAPSPMTIDKHAWDAAGQPFGGAWYERGEQLMKDAWLEANRKDQSTVGGDMGADPPNFPGGYPPFSDNPDDFDGDGQGDLPDIMQAAGGRQTARQRGGTGMVATPTKPGSVITSPVSGTVVAFHPDFRSYRGMAIIKGEDGTYTVVSGLQSGTVKSGDQVNAGDPIGIAGNDVGVSQKGPDGSWNKDPSGLLDGVQAAGPDPVPGYDGGAMADAGGEPVSPTSGLMGAPSASYADAVARGTTPNPANGVNAPAYADAVARGTTPNPSQMAKALSAPTDIKDALKVSLVSEKNFDLDRAIKSTQAELDAVNAQATPEALDVDITEGTPSPTFGNTIANNFGTPTSLGALANNTSQMDVDPMTSFTRSMDQAAMAQALGPPMSDPRAAMHRDSLIDGDLAGPISTPAAPDFMGAFNDAYDAANKGLTTAASNAWGGLQGLFGGSPTDTAASFERGFSPSWGGEDGGDPSKAAMRAEAAALAASPGLAPSQMTTAFNHFGSFGDEAKYGMSDIDASIATDPMTAFTRSMDVAPAMVAGDPMSETMGVGSFGNIGTPDPNQEAAFERGYQEGFAATAAGTPPAPERKVDAFAPGLRAFDTAFQGSVKSVGPKYSKALAAALTTPSIDNQVALTEASQLYGKMNGQPSKAVKGLRSQQIGDFAMANPALGNALGLSMGQQGTGPLGGGLGGDPFGRGGPMGPGFGAGGGFGGGGPGQPSGPSFSGPSGPSGGSGGGYGGGTSGGQPSGPSVSGPSGPSGGAGGSFGGGNPAGSPSPGGVVSGRGPGATPGTGGGISAAAMAGALAGAKAAEAAAAASSDAARGFGGYGGFGPSFSGGFF